MNEGIQAIIRQIDSDAILNGEEHIAKMKTAIDREIERENALFQAELEQRRDMLIANNKRELRHRLERHSRRLNRELLTYRSELLDEIFSMAVRKLSDISEKEYADIFATAIKDLTGSFTLYIGEYSRLKLDSMVIKNAVQLKKNLEIKISTSFIPQKSGFVIRDYRVEYNYLFEDLIDEIKSEQAAIILKEVFEDA